MLLLFSALLTPEIGLIFWTTLIFLLLWTLLGKFAWKPIVNALKEREHKIENSLKQADIARQEMANLKTDHERLLNEAKEERAKIIKEAKEIKDSIISEAKEKAKSESAKIIEDAKLEIHNQKMAAITDVKNLIGTTAIDLAKQVIKRELNDTVAHERFVKAEIEKLAGKAK